MNATGPIRMLRAGVFAAACLCVSAAGHVWMSGRPVPAVGLLLGFVLVFSVALAVAGRLRGLPTLAALMLVGEAALHVLFSATQAGSGSGSATGVAAMLDLPLRGPGVSGMPMSGPGMSGMSMSGVASMSDMGMASAAPGLVPMTALAGHSTVGMVAVHVLAGLVCAWWLYRGERAFFVLLSWALGEAAASLLPSVGHDAAVARVEIRRRASPPGARLFARPYAVLLVHILVRRGPPATVAAG